jgi:hypothetical protein
LPVSTALGEHVRIRRALLAAPTARLAVPPDALPPTPSLEDARRRSAAASAESERQRERFRACIDKASARIDAKLDAILRSGQRAGKARLDAIFDHEMDKADRRCDKKRRDRAETDAEAARQTFELAARRHRLEAIRARIEDFDSS